MDTLSKDVEVLKSELADIPVAPDDLDQKILSLSEDSGSTRESVDQLREELTDIRSLLEAQTAELARPSRIGPPEQSGPARDQPVFTLQLLHASDMDGAVGALDNVENFSAILEGFRTQYPARTLVLSSGDNFIPGPRFFAASDETNDPVLGVSGDGRGDIALLNAMGFQASALGNHELDRGTGSFASIISAEVRDNGVYPGALFPYLSSNLDFNEDENLRPLVVSSGQESFLISGSIALSAVITIAGQRIGVVGATTPALARITGSGGIGVEPADGSDLESLAAIIQESVDKLAMQGIDKVVLLAHMQQIDIEKSLAEMLTDVDIIVAGGSNTILADETDRLRPGDAPADTYPVHLHSADGEPVLLVNTDADYRYLGRLVVGFDGQGVVIPQTVDPFISGAYPTDRQGGQAHAGLPVPEVSRIVQSLKGVLKDRDSNILGKTSVYLSGRRGAVRTEETNLGNLTADANLWVARQVDPDVSVSIKNGGGVRDDIGIVVQPAGTTEPEDVMYLPPPANSYAGKEEGEISQFDIEGSLRFNNGLVILTVTAQELVQVIESTVGFDGVGQATVGSFPQVGGMRFSFLPSMPPGSRVRSMVVIDELGAVTDTVIEGGEIVGDPARPIRLVTLNYLANLGDDFPVLVPHRNRVDLNGEVGQFNSPDLDFPDTNGNGVIDGPVLTDPGLSTFAEPGTEQDAFAEYLAQFFSETPFDMVETSPPHDQRIQNLGIPGKVDTVLTQNSK